MAGLDVRLHEVQVKPGDVIARAGDTLSELFFPVDATVLLTRQTHLDRFPLTVGLIGYEGLVGWPALLTIEQWTHNAIIISTGKLVSVARSELLAACSKNAAVHRVLLRVAHNHSVQLAQSVIANLGHSIERRLARWLLMLDDRTHGDTITITHAQLAQMLNVRRATVTDAVHVLEGELLLQNNRGKVQVRDRHALEARAGLSYGAAEHDYAVNIQSFGKGAARG